MITDAGVNLQQANLILEENCLAIKVETFKHLYSIIRQNLINLIKAVQIKELDTSSYISLCSDYTNPVKGNEIRKKIQETFNVSISYPVFRDFNKEYNQEGRGGFKVEFRNSPSYYVKKYDQRIITHND